MSLQKHNYVRSNAIRKSANGEVCTLRVKCDYSMTGVVWCHANSGAFGKGKSIKASDLHGFYGCSHCHDWFDREADPDDSYTMKAYMRANAESLSRLLDKGIISVKP